MRFRLLRVLARALMARAAVVALMGATGLALHAPAASAASIVYECRTSTIGCIQFSGYAGKSVWGYPVNSSGNNCVNYVAYRLAKNGVPQQSNLGNGGDWAGRAKARGFLVDRTPRIGSIAQWNYGSYYAPSAGHVGYVEEVTPGYIVISDSSWSGGSYRWRIPTGDPNWPNNFIHFKDTAYQPPPSGSFVKVRESSAVYRLVGRTPIVVSTWAAFGGVKPTHALSSSSLASLPAVPSEGTFLRGAQRGEVYRVVAGSPVYVASWAGVGGSKPTMTVDQVAIDRAGSGGAYNRLRYRPADGAYVKGVTTGRVYKMSGGVAYYVRSWTQVGGPKPTTGVDQTAVNMAGTTTPTKWTHLKGRSSL